MKDGQKGFFGTLLDLIIGCGAAAGLAFIAFKMLYG